MENLCLTGPEAAAPSYSAPRFSALSWTIGLVVEDSGPDDFDAIDWAGSRVEELRSCPVPRAEIPSSKVTRVPFGSDEGLGEGGEGVLGIEPGTIGKGIRMRPGILLHLGGSDILLAFAFALEADRLDSALGIAGGDGQPEVLVVKRRTAEKLAFL